MLPIYYLQIPHLYTLGIHCLEATMRNSIFEQLPRLPRGTFSLWYTIFIMALGNRKLVKRLLLQLRADFTGLKATTNELITHFVARCRPRRAKCCKDNAWKGVVLVIVSWLIAFKSDIGGHYDHHDF